MNKIEGVISGLIVAVIALVLIFKAIGKATKYIVNRCTDVADRVVGFFGLAPDMFWALVIMIFVTTVLIWAVLKMYHSIVKMRDEPSIVEVKSSRAFIWRNGELTAVSFEGDPITMRRIELNSRRLTDAELRVLRRREDERRRVGHTQSREIEYKSGSSSESHNVPIPGCHH